MSIKGIHAQKAKLHSKPKGVVFQSTGPFKVNLKWHFSRLEMDFSGFQSQVGFQNLLLLLRIKKKEQLRNNFKTPGFSAEDWNQQLLRNKLTENWKCSNFLGFPNSGSKLIFTSFKQSLKFRKPENCHFWFTYFKRSIVAQKKWV